MCVTFIDKQRLGPFLPFFQKNSHFLASKGTDGLSPPKTRAIASVFSDCQPSAIIFPPPHLSIPVCPICRRLTTFSCGLNVGLFYPQ